MKKKTRNGIIDLWKFIYCLMIIALHIGATVGFKYGTFFDGGSIGIAFFFIVSGYLMGKKALATTPKEGIGKETFKYLKKKIKGMYPFVLLAYLCTFLVLSFTQHISLNKKILSIFELLFLDMSGIKGFVFNYGTWYISAMLICMLVLYPLILKYKDSFLYIIGPLIVILVGGHISNTYIHLAKGVYTKMLGMALFELSLGVCLVPLVEKIKNTNFTKLSKALFTIIEAVGFASVLIVVNIKDSHVKYDFVLVLIFAICIAIAFSEQSLFFKKFSNTFVNYLGRLSLPLYLNQVFIIEAVVYFVNKTSIKANYFVLFGLVFGIDFLFSNLFLGIIERTPKKLFCKLKKILIEESSNF